MTTSILSAFDPRAFEGTAEYYVAGRPPYSMQLADTIARERLLDGTGQLVDVGCGPGVPVLALAQLFDQVTALDPHEDICFGNTASNGWLAGFRQDDASKGTGKRITGCSADARRVASSPFRS